MARRVWWILVNQGDFVQLFFFPGNFQLWLSPFKMRGIFMHLHWILYAFKRCIVFVNISQSSLSLHYSPIQRYLKHAAMKEYPSLMITTVTKKICGKRKSWRSHQMWTTLEPGKRSPKVFAQTVPNAKQSKQFVTGFAHNLFCDKAVRPVRLLFH